uniref:Uncharacterized protein n=1 Tax=Rhizophora mucronata TaxID=61149 RepID=A0A2P2NG49_RHIMU
MLISMRSGTRWNCSRVAWFSGNVLHVRKIVLFVVKLMLMYLVFSFCRYWL